MDYLQKYPGAVIDALVSLPEFGERRKLSPKDFLTMHSGTVIAGKELHLKKVTEFFLGHIEKTETGMHFTWELTFAQKTALETGSCVAVSCDGYFLTAAHVVNKPNPFVICLSSDHNNTHLVIAECRTVMMDPSADCAIFKAEMSTPWYLPLRQGPLENGEIVYAGGWMHERAGGECIHTEMTTLEINGKHVSHSRIVTSIPIIEGDSGSPLINRGGELCGIMSQAVVGKWWKLPSRSEAVMLDVGFINEMINEDRLQRDCQRPASQDPS